jgi:hypothetical protein
LCGDPVAPDRPGGKQAIFRKKRTEKDESGTVAVYPGTVNYQSIKVDGGAKTKEDGLGWSPKMSAHIAAGYDMIDHLGTIYPPPSAAAEEDSSKNRRS